MSKLLLLLALVVIIQLCLLGSKGLMCLLCFAVQLLCASVSAVLNAINGSKVWCKWQYFCDLKEFKRVMDAVCAVDFLLSAYTSHHQDRFLMCSQQPSRISEQVTDCIAIMDNSVDLFHLKCSQICLWLLQPAMHACLYKCTHTQPSIRTITEWQQWAGFCEGVNGRSRIIPTRVVKSCVTAQNGSRVSVSVKCNWVGSTWLVDVHVCVVCLVPSSKSTHFCPSQCECKTPTHIQAKEYTNPSQRWSFGLWRLAHNASYTKYRSKRNIWQWRAGSKYSTSEVQVVAWTSEVQVKRASQYK